MKCHPSLKATATNIQWDPDGLQENPTTLVTDAKTLANVLPIDTAAVQKVIERYPMQIPRYFLSLIKTPGDPIWRQAIPDMAELADTTGLPDPLMEKEQSPVPHLTHRYPDRVLFMVTHQCAMYCRFCTRKRLVGQTDANLSPTHWQAAIRYIHDQPSIHEVILSGGDPLMLPDQRLRKLLTKIRKIPHVDLIRVHTRVPCTLPRRVTPELAHLLKSFGPLWINTHFNHPDELTPAAVTACDHLTRAGISLGCQSVLLKEINDTPAVLKALFRKLLRHGIKPYYLHHPDWVRGIAHFRHSLDKGRQLLGALRGHVSGMCIPHYVIDLPGGGGKVPILPQNILEEDAHTLTVKNYLGDVYQYPKTEKAPIGR